MLGGFDASNYLTERKWATAPDGNQIPLSIVYRKDRVKLDGSDPLLLYGYGSYEVIKDLDSIVHVVHDAYTLCSILIVVTRLLILLANILQDSFQGSDLLIVDSIMMCCVLSASAILSVGWILLHPYFCCPYNDNFVLLIPVLVHGFIHSFLARSAGKLQSHT